MSAWRDSTHRLKFVALLIPLPLLWFAFRGVDLNRSWSLLEALGGRCFWLVLPLAGAMLLDTLSWRLILDVLRPRISFLRLLSARIGAEAVLLGVSGGAVLADAAGPYFLKRHWDIPLPATLASAALRKCALVIAQALYLGLGAFLGYRFLEGVSRQILGGGWLPAAALATAGLLFGLGLLGASMLTGGTLFQRLHGVLSRVPGRRFRGLLRVLRRGFGSTDRSLSEFGRGHRLRWLGPVGLYLLVWLAESLETFLILRVLGVDIGLLAVLALEPVVVLLRYVFFFIPGGVGVQEVGYLAFFRAAGIPAPAETALAFSLIKRTRELLWILLGYAVIAVNEGRPAFRPATGQP